MSRHATKADCTPVWQPSVLLPVSAALPHRECSLQEMLADRPKQLAMLVPRRGAFAGWLTPASWYTRPPHEDAAAWSLAPLTWTRVSAMLKQPFGLGVLLVLDGCRDLSTAEVRDPFTDELVTGRSQVAGLLCQAPHAWDVRLISEKYLYKLIGWE